MKTFGTTVAMCLIVGLMSAGCMLNLAPSVKGSGVSKTELRTTDAFTKIRLEGSPDVVVNVAGPGAQRELTITSDDNIVPLITTDVRDGTLTISSEESYNTRMGVKVTITVESLEAASIAGSGSIDARGVKGARFAAEISGSGDVKVQGEGDSISCKVTGSGDIDATKFNAAKATATVTGSGDVTVNATDSLSATVTGSGDVHYTGSPKSVQRQVTGSGSVSGK